MKGSYDFKVKSKKLLFEFTIKKKHYSHQRRQCYRKNNIAAYQSGFV